MTEFELEVEVEFENDFLPLDKSFKNAEEISRPSLTYWQDAKRRLLKNKIAVIALIVLTIIVLMTIIVPETWKFGYNDQNLIYSNIGPRVDVIEVDGFKNYIHKKKGNKIVAVSKEGEILNIITPIDENPITQINTYLMEDTEVVLDYSIYKKGVVAYNKIVKKAKRKIKKTEDASIIAEQNAIIAEQDKILEKTPRYRIIVNGKEYLKITKTINNKTYIWGTDGHGRDMFVRVMYGGRISLLVGVVVATLNFIVGVTYGGLSGYFGGRVDNVMMRIVDTINSIPMVLYVILLMVIMEPGVGTIVIALGGVYWVRMARLVRAQVLSLKEQEYVLAAETLGASTFRIMFRHLIPNAMGAIMVAFTMQIPSAIFTESFLSFIGIGISPPAASWGSLASDAQQVLLSHPYQLAYPAIVMSITLLAINLFSDGLRDALDPRLRK